VRLSHELVAIKTHSGGKGAGQGLTVQ
jgi:hypothetical protein